MLHTASIHPMHCGVHDVPRLAVNASPHSQPPHPSTSHFLFRPSSPPPTHTHVPRGDRCSLVALHTNASTPRGQGAGTCYPHICHAPPAKAAQHEHMCTAQECNPARHVHQVPQLVGFTTTASSSKDTVNMALAGNSCSGCLTRVCAQVQVHAHTTVGGRYKPGSCHAHKAEEVHEGFPLHSCSNSHLAAHAQAVLCSQLPGCPLQPPRTGDLRGLTVHQWQRGAAPFAGTTNAPRTLLPQDQ
jgi:hypothetical protein